MINEELVYKTLERLRHCAKYCPNHFSNLVPMHRIDTNSMWYVTFYNKKEDGYELHWFDGTSNDYAIEKEKPFSLIEEMYYIKDAEKAVWMAIGKILAGSIIHGYKSNLEFKEFTPIYPGINKLDVSLV